MLSGITPPEGGEEEKDLPLPLPPLPRSSLPPQPQHKPPKPSSSRSLPRSPNNPEQGTASPEDNYSVRPPPLLVDTKKGARASSSSAAAGAHADVEEGRQQEEAMGGTEEGKEAIISPTLLLKERNVMPVELTTLAATEEELGAAGSDDEATMDSGLSSTTTPTDRDNGERLDMSIDPYVSTEGGAAGGPTRTVRFAAGEDGQQPSDKPSGGVAINPALSRSYHVRQLAFQAAKRYSQLYTEQEGKHINNEYQDILRRHNNNTAIRKLNKTIVNDVLDPSNTRLPTVVLNGLCPIGLRTMFNRCCQLQLTPNYWQKNVDDEITFYSLQFVAFSILPIFPTLVSSIISILSISWTISKRSCQGYSEDGSRTEFKDSDLTTQCPLSYSMVFERTVKALNFRTAHGLSTNPVIWDQQGQCAGIASQISMINGYQIGLVLEYVGFISWASVRLWLKLRQLRYMKIASHLKSVYVPEAFDLEGQPWYRVLFLQLQANLPDIVPLALTGLFLYLQIKLSRADGGAMPCLLLHDASLLPAATKAIRRMTSGNKKLECIAVCNTLPRSFRIEYSQVTISPLEVIIQTGIFAATARTLVELLHKNFFWLNADRFMGPRLGAGGYRPYKSVHEYRSRIMTRRMIDDYELLRKEMFIDTVKKQFPALFELALHTPKYFQGGVLNAAPTPNAPPLGS